MTSVTFTSLRSSFINLKENILIKGLDHFERKHSDKRSWSLSLTLKISSPADHTVPIHQSSTCNCTDGEIVILLMNNDIRKLSTTTTTWSTTTPSTIIATKNTRLKVAATSRNIINNKNNQQEHYQQQKQADQQRSHDQQQQQQPWTRLRIANASKNIINNNNKNLVNNYTIVNKNNTTNNNSNLGQGSELQLPSSAGRSKSGHLDFGNTNIFHDEDHCCQQSCWEYIFDLLTLPWGSPPSWSWPPPHKWLNRAPNSQCSMSLNLPGRTILTPHHILRLSTRRWRRRILNGQSPVSAPSSPSSKENSTNDNYHHHL